MLAPLSSPEIDETFRAAYYTHRTQERINTGKLASLLVVALMPAGFILDWFMYPERLALFTALRIASSLVAAILLFLHYIPVDQRFVRWLSLPIALNPAFFICWMIALEDGPRSTYYAGLCLVLLAVNAVVHWSFRESLAAVTGITLLYLAACGIHGFEPGVFKYFVINSYFLVITGLIVMVGNYVFSRLRFQEFRLSFELDRSRTELEESHQKLLELDQAKSHFFANISHELRTPLTLLLAPLESLLNKAEVGHDPTTRDLLLTMQSNGMRLLKLINDLLDLVRLESGRMDVRRENVELRSFLKGLVSATQGVADGKHITLHTTFDANVAQAYLDRDKMEKILLNLLFNALKFTPENGRVELQTSCENEHLVLKVRDSGIGIPSRQLANVFNRFWQADSSARRKHQGAGIGLALVKELTEVQGGEVSVQSVENQGTTFTVRLPLLTPDSADTQHLARPTPPDAPNKEWLEHLYRRAELFPAIASNREPSQPSESIPTTEARQRILVADDEPDMLRFLRTQLSRHYVVEDATDGRQAVERALKTPPDLILLDMMMPEMDGLQACRELRQQEATRNIPVVLLTARADEETKLATLSAGANDFLTKPFSTTELEVRVRNLVENHLLQLELARQNRLLEATIEQLKETEVQLVQAEKLASLGRLSAGIIHEINNPLNFATTNLFALRRKTDQIPESTRTDLGHYLNDIDEGIRRVRDIVTNLRVFTHPGAGALEDIPLADLMRTALRLLSHELGESVQLENRIAPDISAYADRNRLLQVVVNLLQNAVDALKTRNDTSSPGRIWLEARRQKQQTILTIGDNGPGIDPAIRDKVFEPFFTTKDVGQGLGLGLSISYRILEQLGGTLTVRSELGRYTEMDIHLPASPPPNSPPLGHPDQEPAEDLS